MHLKKIKNVPKKHLMMNHLKWHCVGSHTQSTLMSSPPVSLSARVSVYFCRWDNRTVRWGQDLHHCRINLGMTQTLRQEIPRS